MSRWGPLRSHDPQSLGAYELVGRLGEGGMGTVFLARTAAGAEVALKMVRADLAGDGEFRRRFRSEVARARQVPPFCTAEVLDADPDHEHPYLVVEYVDGPTLAEAVEQRGPLTPSNLHGVAIGVATALTAIHGAGVIHRDLKPRNVLLAPGSPKVIDFGIARAAEGTGGHTVDGQMVGTVAYMAPERFSDEPLTPAADVFAWGAVVAYAGMGRSPFGGDSAPATAGWILTRPPDLDGLSGPLRDLVAAALAKDPAERPTARDLLDLLVSGPEPAPAAVAALAGQPDLDAAAREARAVTGVMAQVGYDEDSIVTVPVSELPSPPVGPVPAEPPAEPGRPWFLPVAAALLVLTAVVGAVLVVMFPPGRGDATGGGGTHGVTDEVLSDDLDRPRLWVARAEEDGSGECRFEQALVVTVAERGLFKCRGPQEDLPVDVSAEVGVRLRTPQACAAIWLRYRLPRGYQVRVCSNSVYVSTHKGSDVRVVRTIPLDEPIAVGGPATRIRLRTSGGTVEVLRDGESLGRAPLTDPEIIGGQLLLGVYTDRAAPEKGPFTVTFDHINVWTG